MTRGLALVGLLWLLLAVPAGAGDLADLDTENGFRGLHFGVAHGEIESLELLSENGARGTRLYTRANEPLEFGSGVLDGVTYGFYRDRLYFVALFASGRGNSEAVLEALQAAYGDGERLAGEAVEYVWQGSRVALHFREDPATGFGMASLTGLAMDARVKSASAAAEVAP